MAITDHGNIDLTFTVAPATGTTILLSTNINATPAYFPASFPELLSISVSLEEISGSLYVFFQTSIDSDTYDQCKYEIAEDPGIELDIRIFIFDKNISGYCNDILVYSYTLQTIVFPVETLLSLIVSGSTTTISNICWRELSDAREAVFVDYEATTENAIQSIIQQRPIEINPEIGREMSFTWDATKDEIPATYIKAFADNEQDNTQLSSDGIVYYEDVGIAINEDVAKDVGFITRMYRLSELTVGALTAAQKYQTHALQKRHSLSANSNRIDPRIENRDILIIDLIVTGTNRHLEDRIIVEDVNISLQDGQYRTSISGRKDNG